MAADARSCHGEGAPRRPFSVRWLGSAVDALFEARAADDLVAIAEAGLGASLTMLVPERRDTIVERTKLGGEDDVVSLGQTVQETGTLLA